MRSVTASSGSLMSAIAASTTSPRLCGGILVAIPTAMPEEPLTQEVGVARRENRGFGQRPVVVGHPIDGFLGDVVAEQLFGQPGQPDLGVTHRRRRIAIDRSEVALAVDQRVAHREILRQTDRRVVDRLVAVGVVLAHHIADDAGRLLVRAPGGVAALPHPVQDAAVDGFETVADVRQGAPDDDGHRVVEVGVLEFLLDRDRHAVRAQRGVVFAHLDIQVPGFEGIRLDELPPRFHRVAHQDGEQLIRVRRVFNVDLQEAAPLGIHGGFPELARIHLAEALVT